jgi:lactoylglutathione lyase
LDRKDQWPIADRAGRNFDNCKKDLTMAKIIHVMIRVIEIERAIDFYNKAFGLKIVGHFDFDDFELVYLRNPENDFEVELTLNKGRATPYSHGDGSGHLAVCVDNCGAERDRLKGLGFEPGEVKEFLRDGKLMARFFFIQDPDGYKIEVLERHGRYW